MVEVDPAQREARAREVRHEVVAQLTVGAHRTFRILFAVLLAMAAAATACSLLIHTFVSETSAEGRQQAVRP